MTQHYNLSPSYPQLQQLFTNQQPKQEVVKVNGKAGAEAFYLPPDSNALLLDTTQPIVWFVQTDGAGYKTATAYDISPHVEQKEEDRIKALDDRITRLEEKIDAKSNTSANGWRKHEQRNDAGNRSNDKG